jgi:hypothetical protein
LNNQAVCSQTDVCSDSSAKCCAGSAADYLKGVTKCLTSCYTPIPQWNTCNPGADVCATNNDQCCYGSAADLKDGKSTCRPASNCYTAPVPVPETTQPPKVPIPQWYTCIPGADVCATNNDQCCYGSAADLKDGKSTCRPASNCYTAPVPKTTQPPKVPTSSQTTNVLTTTQGPKVPNPTPIQPDLNFLGGYNWNQKVFAPYVDITKSPLFDAVTLSNLVGSARYLLGWVTSDVNGNAVWGAESTGKLKYTNNISVIRGFGGDVGVSFGGPGGMCI